ncbi:MAG: hypothetical protein P8Y81_06885 [Ignavibacteriaceae bacterium]
MNRRRLGARLDIIPKEFNFIIEIERLKDTEEIYEGNCHELINALSGNWTKNEGLKRKLHNFLAANSTIIDHTRRLVNKYPQVKNIISEKIKKEFEESPLNNFVKDLRNYCLHYSLPLIMGKIKSKDDGLFVTQPILFKEKLLKWSGWNKYSKSFILNSESDLLVRSIIAEHYNRMVELYAYLRQALIEVYNEEYKKYDEFLDKFFNVK